MTNHTTSPSRVSAETVADSFFAALASEDAIAIHDLLDENVLWTIPLSSDGNPEPAATFANHDQAMQYVNGAFANFGAVRFRDAVWTFGKDDRSVVMQGNGDLSYDGKPYHNVYVFKLEIDDGVIVRVYEYANPVTAKAMGFSAA